MGWVVSFTPISLRTGYFYQGREIALHAKAGKHLKQPHHNTHWWPEENKIEAATLWAVTRNVERVKQITSIPAYAIRKWMKEPWWDNVVQQVRKEQNELLDAKLTEVIMKAVEVIQDRVENGEVYVDRKTKEQYRVPVNVKSASIALDVTSKERHLIRGEATARSETVTDESKLKQLKDQFEKLAKSKQINPSNIPMEGEYVDVSGAGEEEAVESETPSGAEESPTGEECEGSWERDELQDGEVTEDPQDKITSIFLNGSK